MFYAPHATDSIASSTSLTSVSSTASVEFYEKRLKPSIDAIKKSETPLQELVDAAEKVIKEFAPDPKSTFTHKHGDEETSVQLDEIMTAMLASAEDCQKTAEARVENVMWRPPSWGVPRKKTWLARLKASAPCG
jgi:hypothetical protein